jgi:uncharacterized phage-like protein YoqJ
MPGREHDNIFLTDTESFIDFITTRTGHSKRPPGRNPYDHGKKIIRNLEKIFEKVANNKEERSISSLQNSKGMYLTFIGEPGYDLYIKSLEHISKGIRLLNVKTLINSEDKKFDIATIFLPDDEKNYFLNKTEDYINKRTPKDKPKNERLISSINNIQLAVIESFWHGDRKWMPKSKPEWCEIWLCNPLNNIDDSIEVYNRKILAEICEKVSDDVLQFPERTILLCKINNENIRELLYRSENIAEIRRSSAPSDFFVELNKSEQIEWSRELLDRVRITNDNNVYISILDTGINNSNLLLSPVLNTHNCLTYNSSWGTHDHEGHGTLMAGVCTYGDLCEVLSSQGPVRISHFLESHKIIPPIGQNPYHLYGAITANSISKLIINNPHNKRIYCMAVTSPNFGTFDGSPSSWSAALDSITSGDYDEIQKLLIVSCGNIDENQLINSPYPTSVMTNVVQNPAQSWNAVSVGAYTNIDFLDPKAFPTQTPLAKANEISPYSTSSLLWDNKWPIKPEIVLEGGNRVKDNLRSYQCDELSVLSTSNDIQNRIFESFWATSAATAEASRMAAILQSKYPEILPETIRALLIHSAEWTDEMKQQFLDGTNKESYLKLLRICGYGIPNIEKAIACADNSVNLIIESELQPYYKINNEYKTKDMHLHELPWPKAELENLHDSMVKMKVTLSYFIEPGPGEVGWKHRYRYPSCGLRFDLNGSQNKGDFVQRINKAARGDEYISGDSNGVSWLLGPNNRNVGSIHSDTWIGTGAQLATSNYIGVYPVIGWWRERHHLSRWNKKIRYSLVVSLSTPESTADLYTPIINIIKPKTTVEIPTKKE